MRHPTTAVVLHQADCLDFLPQLADDSVDLIATDPPYYRVKDEDWDRQWTSSRAFFEWLDAVLAELARVLRPGGSLYLFAGPHLATRVELAVSVRFRLLNHIVWAKPTGRHLGCRKEDLRRYFPATEHVMFAESRKPLPFAFEPIRAHLEAARLAAGVSRRAVEEACGNRMSGHWFGRSQWQLPSEAHYTTMNGLFSGRLKPYAEVLEELAGLERSQRFFAVTKSVPFTNVWTFKPVQWYPGKHPCEKPAAMMEHIVTASSRPGYLVLDVFAGSGSMALACLRQGRRFVGCELDGETVAAARTRLAALDQQAATS